MATDPDFSPLAAQVDLAVKMLADRDASVAAVQADLAALQTSSQATIADLTAKLAAVTAPTAEAVPVEQPAA